MSPEILKTEALKKWESKLYANILTNADEELFEALNGKYETLCNALLEENGLIDFVDISVKIMNIFRIMQIKEYLLQKETIKLIAKLLHRSAN